MSSSPVTSFLAFLWALSRTLTSLLYCGVQNCTQHSKWGCTSTKGRIASFDQMVMLCFRLSSKMHGFIWSKDLVQIELCSTILSFHIHLIPEYLFLWGTSYIFARPDFLMRSPVAPTSTGWQNIDKHILILGSLESLNHKPSSLFFVFFPPTQQPVPLLSIRFPSW